MISIKSYYNHKNSCWELTNRLAFKSKYKSWSKNSYELTDHYFSIQLRYGHNRTIGPTCLSTWSK